MLVFDNGKERQKVAKGTEKSFGLVMAGFFGILFVYGYFSSHHLHYWQAIIATSFLIVSIVRPTLLTPLNIIWFKFGMLLHKITNPLILGILFYLIITPIAMILRLKKRDLLNLQFQPDIDSYWVNRIPPGPEPKTLEKQF